MDLAKLNEDEFLALCIMSTCDYLPSVKGIGFRKAYKYFINSGKNLKEVFGRMKMDSYPVPKDYFKNFQKAFITFKSQVVYCPDKKEMRNLGPNLHDIPFKEKQEALKDIFKSISVDERDIKASQFSDFSFAGNLMADQDLVKQFVEGMIDPKSHEKLKLEWVDENIFNFGKAKSSVLIKTRRENLTKLRPKGSKKLYFPPKNKGIKDFFKAKKDKKKKRESSSQPVEDPPNPFNLREKGENAKLQELEAIFKREFSETSEGSSSSNVNKSSSQKNPSKKIFRPKFNFIKGKSKNREVKEQTKKVLHDVTNLDTTKSLKIYKLKNGSAKVDE